MGEAKEVLPERKELLIEDEGEIFDWELDEEIGEYGNKRISIDRATMKVIARNSNNVKVLRFLHQRSSRDFTCKELYKALFMPYMTVHGVLSRLVKVDVLEKIIPFDKRAKSFRIANLKVADAMIRLHDRFVSFKLAKLLPFSGISINGLKKNPKFLELCNNHGLTVDEGIEALRLNTRKVECVYSDRYSGHKLIAFRRKEQ